MKHYLKKMMKTVVFIAFVFALVTPEGLYGQDISIPITGTVKDITGEPIPGVYIRVADTKNSTATTTNGSYSINVPGRTSRLVFSYVGFTSQEVTVNDRGVINIVLLENTEQLDEIVVVGYGTQKKVNLTGSISTVNSETLKNRPTTSLVSAIQGSMPGVAVTQASGQPGAGRGVDNIRVRGIGTLNNSNPMVVIDGIVSAMNDVNPEDIESFTVLKDAASAAIYGSRAANGVILISTKRGKKNSMQLNFSANVGYQSATRLPDFLGSADNAILANESLVNEGKAIVYSDEAIQKYRDGSDPYNYPNTDWLGLFYKGSGLQQNYYMDMTGGGEKTNYAFSLGYMDQEGIVKESSYKRYTSRLNLNSNVNKWMDLNVSMAYSVGNTAEPASSYPGALGFDQMIRQANRISSTVPYKYENGHYGYINDGSPMAWLESASFNNQGRNQFTGNVGLDIKLLEGLKFKPTFGYNYVVNSQKRYIADIQYYDKAGNKTKYQGPNELYELRTGTTDLTFQALLTYDRSFGNHNVAALAGWSRENEDYSYITGFRKNFQNNELYQLNAAPSDGQVAQGSGFQWALESYFGRFTYNYSNTYYFEANVRRDGSSKFSEANRWGSFPSFSAAYRISQEKFFKENVDFIDDLKIRGSWGKLGNQFLAGTAYNVLYYPTYPVYVTGQNYDFGGSVAPGLAQNSGANEDLKWESSENYGVGIDLAMLKQTLNLSVEYYNRLTTDILLVPPVSETFGLTAPNQNVGSVRNSGWEFSASYNNHIGKFHYNVSGNFTYLDNEVVKLINNKPQISGSNLLQEGYPYNSIYGYICDGIFQTPDEVANSPKISSNNKPGDLKYRDISGPEGVPDGKITADDKAVIGKSIAPYTFGFNLALSYSNFDLGIFLQGAAGHSAAGIAGEILNNGGYGKATPEMLGRWQKEGDNSYPRLLYSQTQNTWSSNPSSYWLKKRDYLRLKNLQVGYTIPQAVLDKMGLKKARIYYSAQNLLTFTKFADGFDPEMPGNIYAHPQVLVNSFGLNITF